MTVRDAAVVAPSGALAWFFFGPRRARLAELTDRDLAGPPGSPAPRAGT